MSDDVCDPDKRTNQSHGTEPFLRRLQSFSDSNISQQFVQPEDLFSFPREHSTGPYHETDQPNPHQPFVSA